MVNISSVKSSQKTLSIMPSSVSTRQHSFLSQFMMSMIIVILLVGFCPYVSSSPTPPLSSSSEQINNNNNKMNYESSGLMFDPSDYQTTSTGDSSLLSSPVQNSLPGSSSSSFWYMEPRAHANQFLITNDNENEIIVPKWFTKSVNDDDFDDYIPPTFFFNKRSPTNNGAISNIKKRKQLTKPPMEVMNEIVNSIYLKR